MSIEENAGTVVGLDHEVKARTKQERKCRVEKG